MAELVDLAGVEHLGAVRGNRALADDDDREQAPAAVTAAQVLAHLVDRERPLGDEDRVGAARDPAVRRDPARVTPHDLDHDDPVV